MHDRTLRQTICSAIDVVVQLTRTSDGRRCVAEVLEVVSLRDSQYVTNTLFRLEQGIHGGFVREALNPAGEKLRPDISQPGMPRR